MMAEERDDEIFLYMGGAQEVPEDVRRVRIDKSVKIIPWRAFQFRSSMMYVEFHDGIEIIGGWAFYDCISLRSVKLLGVKVIEKGAFAGCNGLTDVEFGDELETIEQQAFNWCTSLRSITMPSVRTIGVWAFYGCTQLTDLDLPEELDTVGRYAFRNCTSLRRITMPLKDNMIEDGVFNDCPNLTTITLVGGMHKTVASLHLESWKNVMSEEINRINQILSITRSREKTAAIQRWIESVRNCTSLRRITMPLKDNMIEDGVFNDCPNLTTITLVGGMHKTVASLHLESWKNVMSEEINRINQILSITRSREKTAAIQRWIESVIDRIEHYKTEHKVLLKEATTLLELALWKANLDDNNGGILEKEGVRTTRSQRKRARKDICVTSGASIVIKNVLPFLTLLE